jgi:UDP-glucose 4-epimerase
MKILVTGGAGFIGSNVVDAYLAAGHEVAVVDNLSRGSRQNAPAGVRFYQVDLRNRAALEEAFKKEKPEVVNHQAAQIDVRVSVSDPILDAECNVLGSINMLQLAVQHKVRRLIYASTGGAVYGEPKALPATEETPVLPLAPYGVSKHVVEHYLYTYHLLYGLPYVVLRYGNVYGPRQSSKGEAGVVAIFCEQMLAKITPTLYGDGKKTRDYVEVSDVARASVRALEAGDGEIFNIATGIETTDYGVFVAVRDALGIPAFEPKYAPKRPGEVDHIVLSVDKARVKLGWQPQVAFRQGIQSTAQWFKSRV